MQRSQAISWMVTSLPRSISTFFGIEVADIGDDHIGFGNRLQFHAAHQVLIAATNQRRQRHAAQKAARRGLGRIEVAMRVVPEPRRAPAIPDL